MITVDFNRLRIKPGAKVLDIGCGTGRHTCAASRLEKAVVIGSDIRHDDLVETRKRLTCEEKLGVQGKGIWGTIVSDINCLPFKSDVFDLVICSEVLEHIRDEKRALAEVTRVLKPEKDLVVSVPRYLPERICWALSEEYHKADDGHLRIYKKRRLKRLLEKAGARKWAVHFAHSFHTPFWWLKCLVGPTRKDSKLVNLYHDFLVWDMMHPTRLMRSLEKLLNPLLGKSVVLYLRKENHEQSCK
ncbi:MAG: methyltransferase domain-containing protein [Deltaproteobacteria bacterium]|nr:methyltransferase domain-containing protein [Deltaproteobacteria bacterium]